MSATSPVAPSLRRRCAGVVAIEVILATALSVILLGGIIGISAAIARAHKSVTTDLVSTDTRQSVVAALREELRRCNFVSVAADGSSIVYKLPCASGTDGAYTDDKGTTLWGVTDSTGVHADATVTLAFVSKGTVLESKLNADLNRDGDKIDTFEVGTLVRTSSGGGKLTLPQYEIVRLQGNPNSDLDHDLTADPLFAWDATTLRVTVALGRIGRKNVIDVVRTKHFVATKT